MCVSLYLVADLFGDFLGRVNSISDQTGSTDFDDIIPILQREIPGLQVYELENDDDNQDDNDEDEPSLGDFFDVEGKLS